MWRTQFSSIMFVPLTEKEQQSFLNRNGSFIPGYTGHCPTLRFHYGKCYGTKTKEIMEELRDKGVLRQAQREQYRQHDILNPVLQPIVRSKDQTRDYSLDFKNKSPKCILGYTGFIPTLNFRYGKSFGKAADDSLCEFSSEQRHVQEVKNELNKVYRAKSAPKLTSIRGKDEVAEAIKQYEMTVQFKEKEISPDFPPIAGYTGHIPRVKGNEESLSRRYNTVVKRGLTLLREERDKRHSLAKAQKKINDVLHDVDVRYS